MAAPNQIILTNRVRPIIIFGSQRNRPKGKEARLPVPPKGYPTGRSAEPRTPLRPKGDVCKLKATLHILMRCSRNEKGTWRADDIAAPTRCRPHKPAHVLTDIHTLSAPSLPSGHSLRCTGPAHRGIPSQAPTPTGKSAADSLFDRIHPVQIATLGASPRDRSTLSQQRRRCLKLKHLTPLDVTDP